MGTELNLSVLAEQVRTLRLDDRGRVTIPKDLRDELDASEGDKIEIAVLGYSDLSEMVESESQQE